jgi:hypothetical protein
MKKTSTLLALWLGALCLAAQAQGTPKIQFDETTFDFGKTSQVETVSGVFKFKNTGDAILKLDAPKPSCGCTVANLKSDTLAPGETGELPFTLSLGQYRGTLEKHITVHSNDPLTPETALTIKVDFIPLYELNPFTLSPSLAFGTNAIEQSASITRTDGKPLHIVRLDSSKPWIKATIEPGLPPDATNATIRVAITRDGPPRRFNEYVQIYSADQTNAPASSLYIYGAVMGEVAVNPEALYWSIPEATNAPTDRPESLVLRRVTISSADGKAIELKNPQSTIKGLKVELVPQEAGKGYVLLARLDDLPTTTISGSVSFETSVAAQPRIEVPVIVNVFKP